MRLILLPLLAAALTAPAAPPSQPAPQWSEPNSSVRERCADRITQVREAAGQPRLDRSPATPGQGYLIAAVDKRIDGCAVMQMHGDVNDLRPVPAPSPGPARLLPAR